MKVLVACEESQRVCAEFRKRGHEAYSCDLLEPSGGHPEWHIHYNVFHAINTAFITTMDGKEHYINKWDMMIAFPPCTHLAVSGAAWFKQKREDGRQRDGIEFFCRILNAPVDRIAVENPVNIISGNYVKEYFPDLAEKYNLPIQPAQYIHPWMFGDGVTKKTGLWLKNLPLLKAEVTEQPEQEYFEWKTDDGRIKRSAYWYYQTLFLKPEERAKARSKTFSGVARAMGEQWGNL